VDDERGADQRVRQGRRAARYRLASASSLLRLEGFALAQNAIGFFEVWIWPRNSAAVSPVHGLGMSANTNLVVFHGGLPGGASVAGHTEQTACLS
jgi:hypothetical protein